jgi:selenocysteine lyase/cysteine desulfurase
MSFFNRRSFLYKAVAASAGMFASATEPGWSRNFRKVLSESAPDPSALANDETFWHYVQQAYTVSPAIINLNNGGVAPAPKPVQDAMKRYFDFSNEAPSYYMWRLLDQGREPLRRNLAALAGCTAEEIALQRNASEALETVIFGLELKAGDEVVLSKQDYPNMVNAWKQRAIRDGLKLVWVDLKLPSEDKSYLVNAFTNAFTGRTRVVHVTHVINWNGQVLPVKEIAAVASQKGIQVLVDGAHSFAQFDFSVPGLGADYFGSSLHKWLGAPVGTGLLFVKKERIKNLFPLFAGDDPKKDDIRKFENLGTRPFFIEQATAKAIEFHDMIGIQRKQERLFYLRDYWMTKVKALPKVKLGSSMTPGFGSAIGLINIEGKNPGDLDNHLFHNYKVHVTTINWENMNGVRVTPNVYTTAKNLDVLVEGIREFVKL